MSESIASGDLMRISVELIRQMADEPDRTSPVVKVEKIVLEQDGTKTLWLTRLDQPRT